MELLEGGDEEGGEGDDVEDLSDELYDMAVRPSPSTARRRSRGCSAGCASATTAPPA